MLHSLIVYTQPNCQPCKAAMRYLERRGVPFVVRDIAAEPLLRDALVSLGFASTPVIEADLGDEEPEMAAGFNPTFLRRVVKGFEEEGVEPSFSQRAAS